MRTTIGVEHRTGGIVPLCFISFSVLVEGERGERVGGCYISPKLRIRGWRRGDVVR